MSTNRAQKKALPVRCISAAYDWYLTPPDFEDFDVALVVATLESVFSEAAIASAEPNDPIVSIYHADLQARQKPRELADVSGTIGLLYPVSGHGAEEKAAAFERLLGDAIIWQLAKHDFSSTNSTDTQTAQRTIILLQGPLLPKLRGRLLYRGISENVSIYAVTYQPQWFRQIESASHLAKGLDGEQRKISGVYPPIGVDRATRCWVFKADARSSFHFETITNSLACVDTPGWEEVCRSHIEKIMQDRTLISDELINIPTPLAKAVGFAKERRWQEEAAVWFLSRLRDVGHNPREFPAGSREQAIAEAMDNTLRVISKAASKPLGKPQSAGANIPVPTWTNDEDVYEKCVERVPRSVWSASRT